MDSFKKEFKRYKQRKPPPDLSEVIDFQKPEKFKEKIYSVKLNSSENTDLSDIGLRRCAEWKVFSLTDFPGFLFVTNPFLEGCQWELSKNCLRVYSCKPNVTNLDAHAEVEDSIWDTCVTSGYDQSSLLYKLRWVTVGYHYDWNTKTYSQEAHSDFPPDLSLLFVTIAKTLGFKDFRPEAGIINYYHLDSTLGGHTDHSELDLTAPLFSISLGQSAIFLLGGKSRDRMPVAMYMRSGDIMVMAGNSRLAYHAVPRILQPIDKQPLPLCLEPCLTEHEGQRKTLESSCKNCEGKVQGDQSEDLQTKPCKRVKYDIEETSFGCVGNQPTSEASSKDTEETKLLREYLSTLRININVRQILAPGKTFHS